MGFAVCTINLNQLVESGTRKGRGIVLILSVPRAFSMEVRKMEKKSKREKEGKRGAFTHDAEQDRLYCDRDFIEETRVDILAVSGLLNFMYLVTAEGLWSQLGTDDISMTIMRARDKLQDIEESLSWGGVR